MQKRDSFLVLRSKFSQVTIFVIIALIIIAGIAGFFIFKDKIFRGVPSSISPIHDYYVSCIANVVGDGARISGSQAGYIYPENFEPGSTYAPFSSQLAFMGVGIPYWYYVTGNGIKKENIPSKNQIESQIEKYVLEQLNIKCGLGGFAVQGFDVSVSDISGVKISVEESKISFSINQKITIKKDEQSYSFSSYKGEVDSKIGKLYDLAKKIYDYEQKTMFLENYSRDVLYTYAPVSGVELNCSPVSWNPYDVFERLKIALAANIGSIKVKGDYYSLNKKSNSYFVLNTNFEAKNERFNFLYSPKWVGRFEVWPTKNSLMVANPVGTQQGLNVLGFCYAPYKFVYDMYFPVLVQVYDSSSTEMFQFSFAVVIDKNNPREAIEAEYVEEPVDVCENANIDININTYNINLEAVEASLEFKCLTSSCSLGKTKISNITGDASLSAKVPACLNGVLIANSKGYKEKKYIISTNRENTADIVLEREYKLNLEVYVDSALSSDNSVIVINEVSDDESNFVQSVSYPLKKEIILGEGDYEFDLKVYKSGSVVIPGSIVKQCVSQPKFGIIGSIFGLEEEKCYDVNIPSQTLSNLVYAGGKLRQYITESEFKEARTIKIYATSVKLPSNLEEIQDSFDKVENGKLIVDLA